MFTGITSHAGSLVTAIVVLTGAAILAAAQQRPTQTRTTSFWHYSIKKASPPSRACQASSPQPIKFVGHSMADAGGHGSEGAGELCV